MYIIKNEDNRYSHKELQQIMRFNGVMCWDLLHEGDIVLNRLKRVKNRQYVILQAEDKDKNEEENKENIRYLEEVIFKKHNVKTQKVYAVYQLENNVISREVLFFIPFCVINTYSLEELKDFTYKIITGEFNDDKHDLKKDSFVILHPMFNNNKLACIDQKGHIVNFFNGIEYTFDEEIIKNKYLEKKKCLFYYKTRLFWKEDISQQRSY